MSKGNLFRIFLGLSIYFCKNAETADIASISIVGHTGPMIEGTWFELRCDIAIVTPSRLLSVKWFERDTLLTTRSFNNTIKTPVTKSATYWVFPNMTNNGSGYHCEAELLLGLAGRSPPHTVKSDVLPVQVKCNCPLVLQPTAVVVKHGSSVSVNCSTSKTHVGISWEAAQGAVDLKRNVQLITWNVSSLEEWEIKPLCYVNINSMKRDKIQLPVIVYKTPDRVALVRHAEPLLEGKQYELQCNIQNVAPVLRLTVKWYKGHTLLTETFFNDATKTPVNQSATLQITPSRADDGAEYWCEAELRLGPAGPQPSPTMKSDPLNITVYYGPEVSNCPEHVWLKEGESLVGYCSVTGNPLPKSRWQRAGQVVDPALPLSRAETGHDYTMDIIDGGVQHKLTVFVMYGPEISCPNHITVVEDENLEPNCTAAGYPPPEMTWLKEGERVNFPQIMQKTDSGRYVLVASNNSTANHTLEIEVQYSPLDIRELNDQFVTQGSSVDLKCDSSARPRPEYRWIYHPESNVRIVYEDGVSMLFIDNVSGRNIGTYTCIAHNPLGENNRSVEVNVKGAEPPIHLNITPPTVVLEYSKSIEVECTALVSPVRLHWEYLHHTVSERTLLVNSSEFSSWNERPSCIGEFVGLGRQSRFLDITLYKTPDRVALVRHAGPVHEGKQYELQCNIQNVAPVRLLTVKWYKGHTLMTETFFNDTTKTPVNQSATLQITPSRADDGAEYWCEAELRLGPAGPQPSPTMKSDPLNITVHYKPTINKTKFPSVVPVFWGYPEVLVCEADGRPPPNISWSSSISKGGNLTISEATNENGGVYTCTAWNSVGYDMVSVTVVMKVANCPIMLTPPVVLVEYGTSVSVDCSTRITHKGMGWGASQGPVDLTDNVQLITWSVLSLTEWNIKPFCYININKAGLQCQRNLTVNIYKTPDRVSISTLGYIGPMTEGRQYELQCDIQNVAPVRLFTVNWYKGLTLVAKTSISDSTETPVNQSTRFRIVPSRADDGAQYRCEAELDLSWDNAGIQRAPKVSSHVLNITVHYSPEASRLVEIFDLSSEDVVLNCTVTANPPPRYTWHLTNTKKEFNQGLPVLPSSALSSGNYTCTASNRIGTISKLFIVKAKPKGGKSSTFWAIVGPFAGLAVVSIVGYVLKLRIG